MIGFRPLRDLRSAMILTLHVAVVAYAIRTFAGPASLAGSATIWAPLSVMLALFLSVPIGQAIAAAFRPGDALSDRHCVRCGRENLRPLLRAGGGLFPPIVGYRCAGCRTTYRPVGDRIVEEPAPPTSEPPAGMAEGVVFLDPEPGSPEIRFLDEANIPAGPVSDH